MQNTNISQASPIQLSTVNMDRENRQLNHNRLDVYLNSIPSNDGGRTRFPQQDISFEAENLMFGLHFGHTHIMATTKLNKKYIITGWCRYKMEDLQNQ